MKSSLGASPGGGGLREGITPQRAKTARGCGIADLALKQHPCLPGGWAHLIAVEGGSRPPPAPVRSAQERDYGAEIVLLTAPSLMLRFFSGSAVRHQTGRRTAKLLRERPLNEGGGSKTRPAQESGLYA